MHHQQALELRVIRWKNPPEERKLARAFKEGDHFTGLGDGTYRCVRRDTRRGQVYGQLLSAHGVLVGPEIGFLPSSLSRTTVTLLH